MKVVLEDGAHVAGGPVEDVLEDGACVALPHWKMFWKTEPMWQVIE